MDPQKEISDLSLNRVECPVCNAVWLNGQHYWTGTGQKGDEQSLNNLVCQLKPPNAEGCINPSYKKGHMYDNKDSWQKRADFLNNLDFDDLPPGAR